MTDDPRNLRKRLEILTNVELEEILADDGSGFIPEAKVAAREEMDKRCRLPDREQQSLESASPAAAPQTPVWRKVTAFVLLWAGGAWLFTLGKAVVEALSESALPHPVLLALLGSLGGVSVVAGRALWDQWRRVLGIAMAVAALFHLVRGLTARAPQTSLAVVLVAGFLGLTAAALILRESNPTAAESSGA